MNVVVSLDKATEDFLIKLAVIAGVIGACVIVFNHFVKR